MEKFTPLAKISHIWDTFGIVLHHNLKFQIVSQTILFSFSFLIARLDLVKWSRKPTVVRIVGGPASSQSKENGIDQLVWQHRKCDIFGDNKCK